MSASESPETAFWRFSLETYARPGVAEAAIALQDTDGANVNLLLLCLWLAHEKGQSLTGDRLASLSEALAAWSASVTAPLRSVRRSLKTPPPVVADGAAVLKAAVQALELDAERLEQRLLLAALPDPAPAGAAGSAGSAGDLARASLSAYGALLPRDADGDRASRLQGFIKAALV